MPVGFISLDQWATLIEGSKRPVFVEFMTTTCSICAAMAPVVERISEKFEGKVAFYKVNASRENVLAMRYGIMGVPTFMMFCNGKPVSSMSGEVYPALLERMAGESLQYGKNCSKKQTRIGHDITGYA